MLPYHLASARCYVLTDRICFFFSPSLLLKVHGGCGAAG
ncbi:unnamed protein product [Tuber melanosporum]|uniref:(Perigord truffle) hypothetical protein n=1 Tax=Tuber melanosporum (strain Mel28) TaxID=656061 RepID=D5GB15_TUBMM|nr:uncharacterized protein GSTUM_00005399001 [Tuber melanosporum]CAZ81708.1 unnamed protein product [Tuber melanosporum]